MHYNILAKKSEYGALLGSTTTRCHRFYYSKLGKVLLVKHCQLHRVIYRDSIILRLKLKFIVWMLYV